MANLALEMINTVFEAEAEPGLTITFSLRIGINSGTYSVSPSIWLIYSVNADIVESKFTGNGLVPKFCSISHRRSYGWYRRYSGLTVLCVWRYDVHSIQNGVPWTT